jgi:hypothetical protein
VSALGSVIAAPKQYTIVLVFAESDRKASIGVSFHIRKEFYDAEHGSKAFDLY